MGILAMKFLPIGLWRIDKANLFIRTFLFFINKLSCTIYNYHKGKRRTLPYSRQKFAMKFLPIGLWRIDKANLFLRTFLFSINKLSCTIYTYHKGKRRTSPYSRQKFAMKFLPIGLWRIYEADLWNRTILFVINKRCWTIHNYHKG